MGKNKRCANKDAIMTLTTACGKVCTLDTCMILTSGREDPGGSQFATVFLNYQEKK
jgi:hypothetical protein